MVQVALFHSVLGVRTGVLDAASRLRDAGHEVLVVDQYDGRVFDDYEVASAHAGSVGFPALMQVALDAVADLDDGFVAIGFSNGGGMAEHVALHRAVAGVVMLSGTLPLELLGAEAWPSGVPAQIHYAVDDPFRQQAWADSVATSVRAAGAELEVFDYPGAGHLFTDETLPDEHDPEAAELLFERVLDFCARRV
ncbi:dienelactone hydrolase family protein [Solicola sp. PLA-1-18]|uniref:dienelactone hydrolase family protein n=1 Tax=Solicola sp. PLA-1-18 TaxID=3380532 RepID=UPI003B7D36E9